MPARRKITAADRARVQVLAAVPVPNSEVVFANTDYATGGPVHPDISNKKDAPDPAAREDDRRYPGDVITLGARQADALVRSGVVGPTVEAAESDPDGVFNYLDAVRNGKPGQMPACMMLRGSAPAEQAPAAPAKQAPAAPANPPADAPQGEVSDE